MRRLLFIILMIVITTVISFMLQSAVRSQEAPQVEVMLEWDANTEPDLAGYRVYHGFDPGGYERGAFIADVPAGTEVYTFRGPQAELEGKTCYFAITAYDNSGNESGYSNEASRMIDTTGPANPGGLDIKLIRLIADAVENFGKILNAFADRME